MAKKTQKLAKKTEVSRIIFPVQTLTKTIIEQQLANHILSECQLARLIGSANAASRYGLVNRAAADVERFLGAAEHESLKLWSRNFFSHRVAQLYQQDA